MDPQVVSKETKKNLDTRTAKKEELNKLFSDKVGPMFSNVIKRTKSSKEPAAETTKEEAINISEAVAPSDSPRAEAAISEDTLKDEDAVEIAVIEETEETTETKEEGSGFSIGSFKIDWKKFDVDAFKDLSKIFREEEVKEEEPVPAEPMVIVADFTLPYQCCEDYACEDMCYSDEELAMLMIPPFAKDDFAVTRKDTEVHIYPDLNDSHLFKDFIVVKEIEKGETFSTVAGGKVTTDKTSKHPRFIYTPPEGESGISDSFNYTLLNLKNELSDTATIWIEVSESVPEFSMADTSLCHNGNLEPIIVDSNENDWNAIEVNGNGVEKDTSASIPLWNFNPKKSDVIIGVNTLTLTLNSQSVATINVTVTEIKADFEDQGEVQSIDPESNIGMIVIHDLSLNVQDYDWEWQQGSGPIQT
ncbi:MAG: hypothetical protein M3R17_12475, partial [Bacteroidota bacterium]|nr:hypothetical protein [Bacteroidota bacterium]